MSLSDIITVSLDRFHHIAKTETVFGEPLKVGDDITLVPVSKVSIGFGAGGAGKDDKCSSGAGTGGGVTVTPVALISISKEGGVEVHPLTNGDLGDLGSLLSLAPEAVKKMVKLFKKKEDDESQNL
ncbi:MAG: hypothetical protein LBC59_01135 [Chitinispirillales bacterium]|jgi:uncharacterized spore protein YtfJ|nr:hypothetical protein [Chitinispirillales bacterium]